jgi:hypothetical protein
MRTFAIVHILLLLLALLVYNCAGAQDYAISVKGDTLRGDVKPVTFGIDKKVYIISPDKRKTSLSIFQVKEFRRNGEIFHPVKNEKGYTFMKLVKPGYLSIYSFQFENQYTYDGLFLLKKDGSRMEVPNLSFRKVVARFLQDCKDVHLKIQSGAYGRRELGQIVDEYNRCITDRSTDYTAILAKQEEQKKDISAWDRLEENVKAAADFEGKSDAIEMITDIKGKIKREEKVPNFLVEGLKKSLTGSTQLLTDLDSALNELKHDQ